MRLIAAGQGGLTCRHAAWLVLQPRQRCAGRCIATRSVRRAEHVESVSTIDEEQLDLQHVLQQLRTAMGITTSGPHGHEVIATGRGRHLGIKVAWRLRWRPDGAFLEEIRGKELGFKWGFDGGAQSSCWEVDSSGVSRGIECDDHEALLLGVWVRTGSWLQPQLQDRLHIELEPPEPQRPQRAVRPLPKGASKTARRWAASIAGGGGAANGASLGVMSDSSDAARVASGALASTSGSHDGAGGEQGAPGAALASPSEEATLNSQPVTLSLRLKGGKLVNKVRVCTTTWTTLELVQPLCGVTETWLMLGWKTWEANRVQYPSELQHLASGGGKHLYETVTCQLQASSPQAWFQLPVTPLLPVDASYNPALSPEVPIWRASTGHFIIKPEINGIKGDYYWLLDTGASGFVISPKAALSLGLQEFGELFAASIAGKVPARFIKAASWSLGPLTIRDPVMMTMDLQGLVRGGPGEVLGIVGFDLFRRAVVELPQLDASTSTLAPSTTQDTPGAAGKVASAPRPRPVGMVGSWKRPAVQAKAGPHIMLLHNPDTYTDTRPDGSPAWVWHPVTMVGREPGGLASKIASLPHVEVKFADAQGVERTVLLMLDTGACGADIMLHSRCIKEFQLDLGFEQAGRSSSHHIRGVGGSSADSMRVDMVEVPWMDMAGVNFQQVRVMRATSGGLDISVYSGGIVCGDLVARVAMAFDYSRKRIGFRPEQLQQLLQQKQ